MTKGKLARETKEHYKLSEIERGLRNKQLLYTYAEKGDLEAVHLIVDAERALQASKPTALQLKTVQLYWKDGRTLAETGAILGVSPQAVRFNMGLLKVKLQKVLDAWVIREIADEQKGDRSI